MNLQVSLPFLQPFEFMQLISESTEQFSRFKNFKDQKPVSSAGFFQPEGESRSSIYRKWCNNFVISMALKCTPYLAGPHKQVVSPPLPLYPTTSTSCCNISPFPSHLPILLNPWAISLKIYVICYLLRKILYSKNLIYTFINIYTISGKFFKASLNIYICTSGK